MPSQQTSKYGLGLVDQTYEFPLPSGNTCLLRRADPMMLLNSGILDNFDALTAMVAAAEKPAEGSKVAAVKAAAAARKGRKSQAQEDDEQGLAAVRALLQNGNGFSDAMRMMDKVVSLVVAEPAVTYAYAEDGALIPRAEREPGHLYTDSVSLEDKTAIMTETFSGVDAAKSGRKR